MPLLLRMIYRDSNGNVLKDIGPEELYLSEVSSPCEITFKIVTDILEIEMENYDWSGLDEIDFDWQVISSYVF